MEEVDWVSRLAEEAEKHQALIILDIDCLCCRVEGTKLSVPIILKTKLNLKWLDDHKSIMTIICKECALSNPPPFKIVNNIVKKLVLEESRKYNENN